MINNDPNFERNEQEKQAFLLFSMMVAGKNAQLVLEKVNTFIEDVDPNNDGVFSACAQLDQLGMLEEKVYEHKLGNYTRFFKFIREIWRKGVDLDTCTTDDLECLHGVGPKTSRFFLSFTRPNQTFAILDRHVLSWMREQGVKAPKTTPTDKRKYAELEKVYLEMAGKDPTHRDYEIWKQKRRKVNVEAR